MILDERLPHIFGLTVLGDRLYWTDWQKRAVESVNKRLGNDRQIIIDTMDDLMGLKAVNLAQPYGSNCQSNNGGCSHLCLYRPSRVQCACPAGMKLSTDKKTCMRAGVDGRYTAWSNWGACSTSCNPGVQIKTRTCTNPPPWNGGKDCRRFGPPRKFRICNKKPHQKCP